MSEATGAPKVMRNRKPADGPETASKPETSTAGAQVLPSTLLRSYAAYRRAQLYKPRLGGQIGGTHGVMAQSVELILRELEAFADWMDEGEPGAAAILTQEQLDFWMEARRLGVVEIPDDIKRALPDVG